jgi:hypothetical protein
MDPHHINELLDDLTEELASIEYKRRSHWQRYLHSNGVAQPDGSLLLPADLVNKWERLIATKYENLTEEEKESDREQVEKYLPLLRSFLTQPEKS